jgi:hypothetical protein
MRCEIICFIYNNMLNTMTNAYILKYSNPRDSAAAFIQRSFVSGATMFASENRSPSSWNLGQHLW